MQYGRPVGILGIQVATESLDDIAHAVVEWAEGVGANESTGQAPARYVCATSVHGIVEAAEDPSFAAILNGAAVIAPDGMPLVWMGKALGRKQMSRVYGPDLMARICQRSASRRIRHFFYGAGPGVAEELAANLARRFPGLQVAGTFTPPFRPLTPIELDDVAGRINDSGADIVWVGLSTPKQERWIDSIRQRLRSRVLVSVGAAFDYHTGRIRRAPGWMQRAGLEWFYRLVQEPRRLWKRYAYNNPVFVMMGLLQLLGLRRFPPGVAAGDRFAR